MAGRAGRGRVCLRACDSHPQPAGGLGRLAAPREVTREACRTRVLASGDCGDGRYRFWGKESSRDPSRPGSHASLERLTAFRRHVASGHSPRGVEPVYTACRTARVLLREFWGGSSPRPPPRGSQRPFPPALGTRGKAGPPRAGRPGSRVRGHVWARAGVWKDALGCVLSRFLSAWWFSAAAQSGSVLNAVRSRVSLSETTSPFC